MSAAVLSAVLCSSAYAAGLGKLTVLSSLGQPLRAEIELTSVRKEEAGTIVAKLASAEAYRQANVEFTPGLFSLRFAVENQGNRHFIRVTSTQPINEPFVAMLIELGGTGNRLVREYTFLLDPADLRMGQSSQIAAAPRAASPAGAAARAQAPAVTTAPVPQPEAQQKPVTRQAPQRAARGEATGAAATAGDDSYKVKQGDTLVQIAGQVKPEGVSLDQMLVALYRANTNAFAGNNMNRLRAGQILSVPDAEAAKSISKSEARGVVVAQAADFNDYRNKLAGQVAASAQGKAAEGSQSAGGKITTQVEEKPNAANDSQDKLKLSKAGAANAAPGAGATGIAAGAEDRIAREKALAEANARVKELEKNVSDLQKLLEIKNKELAAQQNQADAKAVAPAAVAPGAPAAPAAAPRRDSRDRCAGGAAGQRRCAVRNRWRRRRRARRQAGRAGRRTCDGTGRAAKRLPPPPRPRKPSRQPSRLHLRRWLKSRASSMNCWAIRCCWRRVRACWPPWARWVFTAHAVASRPGNTTTASWPIPA